jgi:trehalose synthase
MDTSLQLGRYAQFVGEACIAQIYNLARSLEGLHILHFNTTAHGGGVAELLDVLVPLMNGLGVRHDWKVIQLDPDSNNRSRF